MKPSISTYSGALLAGFILASCGQQKPVSTTNTSPAAPAPHPQAQNLDPASRYANGMINAQNRAKVLSQLPPIQQAVQMFHNQENRFPNSLNELLQEGFLSYLPQPPNGLHYTYNPQNGSVGLVGK